MMRAGLLLLLCCVALPVWAAEAPKPGLLSSHDTSQPVNIAADKMAADLNGKTVTYSGNVVVTQGNIRMHADTVKADQVANKIHADGKVVVDSPASGTATGNNGVYDLTSKLVTLCGHVVLNKAGQATMRGSVLTVNMITGKAELIGRTAGCTGSQTATPGLPGGRVQGVFTPKSAAGGN